MALKLATALRNTRADAIAARAGNAAKLRIYSGSRPANADTAPSGTLLAELTCGTPFAPAASGGVLTANAITQDLTADNTGTASWFRLVDSAGTTNWLRMIGGPNGGRGRKRGPSLRWRAIVSAAS